jgi:hypoxanthine-DNA glycosylase
MTDKPIAVEYGFPPLLGDLPDTLILGSMPGVKSLEHQQYYAHPRNAFWPIMANLLGFDATQPYEQRCDLLKQHNIAVWDVLKACQREGSLDQNINNDSLILNDFHTLLKTHSSIKRLFFNGGKAEAVFKQVLPHIAPSLLTFSMQRLPSTSPAHAAITFEQKLATWHTALLT